MCIWIIAASIQGVIGTWEFTIYTYVKDTDKSYNIGVLRFFTYELTHGMENQWSLHEKCWKEKNLSVPM